jgi:hypothetical protein
MKKSEIKNKTNSELLLERKLKVDEFEKVKMDIVRLYDYWMSIESDYNMLTSEINNRNISE